MNIPNKDVIIVGAGLAGLSCARRLLEDKIPFLIMEADEAAVKNTVRQELTGWFGREVDDWRHVKSYRISHALPSQLPPMPDPTSPAGPIRPGLFVCGEYGSVPGIQWAMLSGRRTIEAIINNQKNNRYCLLFCPENLSIENF